MRKIIQGRPYDTSNATLLGTRPCKLKRDDPDWWEASLYKLPRCDRYFLSGSGGWMTRFATRQVIFPMERDTAEAWLAHYCHLRLG